MNFTKSSSSRHGQRRPDFRTRLLLGLVLIWPATPALAQEGNGEDGSLQTYDQVFFAEYNVQTAEDMLRRLPGVSAILDEAGALTQERGLGSGGDQILIDGKRLAAKNQLIATLRRIPASIIERVELIRGTSGEIQVQSEGLIVNIVLVSGQSIPGAGNFEINYRFDDRGYAAIDGLISYADSIGRLSYTVGFQRDAWTPLGLTPTGGMNDWSRRTRNEVYFYPDGAVLETRPQEWDRSHDKKDFTANLSYDFVSGDQLKFNAFYRSFPIQEIDNTPYVRLSPSGAIVESGLEYHQRDSFRDGLELGAEYQTRLGNVGLDLIALFARNSISIDDFRNVEVSENVTEVSRSASAQDTGEDILRPTFSFALASDQDLRLGFEIARNTLDQQLDVFFDFDDDGTLDPVDLPTANARVEELRGELFATHNWQISPVLSLESSISYEVSRITTNYDTIPTQTYRYPKPRLDLRYNLSPSDRLRLKVERTVSQLDFQNFVPLYNVVDDRIDFGNPELSPEKTWIFEAGLEHRFANDQGSVEAMVFYNAISDAIDRGPFGINSSGLITSAPVNIESASLYGFEIREGLRLSFVGLPDAQLDSRFLWQRSSIRDPFTLTDRELARTHEAEITVNFRHDLTGIDAAYGVNYVDTVGDLIISDIRNLDRLSRAGRLDVFMEKAIPLGLTLRLEAYNLTNSREFKSRSLYEVSQADGQLFRSERYTEIRDRRFAVKLRGTF